ncbi:MAG TPA: methyltransferase domain-containing protein [Mycobacteriales bacterium]|jgi:SAM-dependent methyltransferase|nr:methyltransferase domain-containing protein [Mycobacteriales bacterium]
MTTDVRDADTVTPSLPPVAATLLALAGVRAGETVADVGCGTGLLTYAAAAAAGARGRVLGLEREEALLRAAAARRASGVGWLLGEPAALPLADGVLDKVICGSGLHRFADPAAVLAEVARVLAPGGRLAVCAWGAFRDGGGGTSAEALGALLHGAGLGLVHARSEEVAVPFADGAAYARWRLALGGPGTAGGTAGAAGTGPVVAEAVVHYATARPQI